MNPLQFNQWLKNDYEKSPLIMGILNCTPDSFSDGNQFNSSSKALFRVEEMVRQGADIIDIGGESSRPGSRTISLQEELDRVLPIIEKIRAEFDICLSIDTTKPEVMRATASIGINLINDISALSAEKSLETVAELALPVCLMHMQLSPETMQDNPQYNQIIDDINQYFSQKIAVCLAAGIQREHIILDPGFGFGKTVEHNLQIINELDQFKKHQRPVLIGISRKSTLGALLNKAVDFRLVGGLTYGVVAVLKGAAILRTHDIDETKDALILLNALQLMKSRRNENYQ